MKPNPLRRNVAVIVLNWNGWRDSYVCLESLLPSVREGHASVIVVDNASTDDSVLRLEQWLGSRDDGFLELQDPEGIVQSPECPSFTLIRALRNGGYAAGNNLGIRFALRFPEIEYVFILNNDAAVAPDCISSLLACAERDPAIAIVGSTIVEGGGRIRIAGNRFNRLLTTTKPSRRPAGTNLARIDYICGAAQFIRAGALRKAGLLSEDYFLYFEEIDLTRRITKAGYSIAWCPASIVYHEPGSSAGSRSLANPGKKSALAEYHSNLSCLIYMRKFHPRLLWLAAPIRFLLKLTHSAIYRRPGALAPLMRAYRDYLLWSRRRYS